MKTYSRQGVARLVLLLPFLLMYSPSASAAESMTLIPHDQATMAQELSATHAQLELPAEADFLPTTLLTLGSDGALTLAELQGRVVLIDFWASWCDPCKQSFPWMKALQARHAEQGLVILAINLDRQSKKARSFLQEQQVNFPVLFDSQGINAARNELKAMPTSLLLDRQGRLRLVHQGFRTEDTAQYEACITQLLQEESE